MPLNDANPLNPERRKIHATLDVMGGGTSPFPSPSASPDGPRVELVEGSGQDLSDETRVLLRTRLRAAALVFCLGSLAFFLRDLFTSSAPSADPALDHHQTFLRWFHAVHIGVMALVSYKLCSKCDLSLRWLRVAETLIFGLTALFFVAVQHCVTLVAAKMGYVFNPVALWFTLMFTYAIYIPNTWRRAAIVLGFMAIAPITCLLVDHFLYPSPFANLVTFDSLSGSILMIVIGFFSSLYGTYMIGALRKQAYEAKQLGQYKLGQLIGAGGMGEVYLAEHQMMKRPCAIKVIRPNKARDPRALARFEREVRATAKLSHWNTVEIFDYGRTDDGTFYYVMEYLPGLSLSELVERHGPLAPERVIYLLEQTCDALREAHAAGLVHRDIKPGNIFAAIRGGVYDVAKLLDFGLAKPMVDDSSIQLTQDGMITGSPLFMSPEQAIGETEPDARSDIYSLGAVAYYMLTGRPPFQSDKPMKVMIAHAHDDPTPPSQFRPDLPADLERVVLRSLAKNPADRYTDAGAFARDLASCEAAGNWTREHAANWWNQVGQPAVVGV